MCKSSRGMSLPKLHLRSMKIVEERKLGAKEKQLELRPLKRLKSPDTKKKKKTQQAKNPDMGANSGSVRRPSAARTGEAWSGIRTFMNSLGVVKGRVKSALASGDLEPRTEKGRGRFAVVQVKIGRQFSLSESRATLGIRLRTFP